MGRRADPDHVDEGVGHVLKDIGLLRDAEIVQTAGEVAKRNKKLDEMTVGLICDTAGGVHGEILKKHKPDLAFPVRSLKNVSYSTKRGYFEIGKQKKTRTLTVNTVKSFAQTLRMMGLSKELIESNDFATKVEQEYNAAHADLPSPEKHPEQYNFVVPIRLLFKKIAEEEKGVAEWLAASQKEYDDARAALRDLACRKIAWHVVDTHANIANIASTRNIILPPSFNTRDR